MFVCLPTGFGKSICFLSLPFARDYLHCPNLGNKVRSMLLVVKPTIPTMVDQCRSLMEKGISAAYINNQQMMNGSKVMWWLGIKSCKYISRSLKRS